MSSQEIDLTPDSAGGSGAGGSGGSGSGSKEGGGGGGYVPIGVAETKKHFMILEKKDKGNNKVRCLYCDKEFTGAPVRMRAHLTGDSPGLGVAPCPKAPEEVQAEMRLIDEDVMRARTKKRKMQQLAQLSEQKPGKGTVSGNIKVAFRTLDKAEVDRDVGRFFYATGTPFHVIRSKYFKKMVKSVASFGTSYALPGYNRLRTSMLTQERTDIQQELGSLLENVPVTGCCVTSDGWSDTCNRPLLNILQVTPKGAIFIKSVDTSGETKTGQYIRDALDEVITKIGAEHVVGIITDNGSNCKAAGLLLEHK